MASFYIGQRVRILWSVNWPELAGQQGVIVAKCPNKGVQGISDWWVAPDCWGTHKGSWPSWPGYANFAPGSAQLAPISDSNQLSSWEAMKELNLWVPDEMRAGA